ncbi:MAG: hypothetical protein LBU80_03335 [Rikenellaceae bacterium]|nr:hypothetical protein [Rikenellaceae bacterium]
MSGCGKAIDGSEETRCPVCGSDEVSKARLSGWALFSLYLCALPLPFREKKLHCFDCGHDFKITKGKQP